MAGGVGTRFWPISRRSMPKQFLDILGTGKSFIRSTYERFAGMIPPENFLVSTNTVYKPLVLEHLPELKEHQVLCEPVGRNTAPCITYAAWRLQAMDPSATMIVTPSDHIILNESQFVKAITESADFAEREGVMMTIGIKPNRPDTGYGYIQVEPSQATEGSIYKVKTFTEKPDLKMAEVFVRSGEFFWNSGIFIWSVKTIMENIAEFLPETQKLFASIADYYNTPEEGEKVAVIYPEAKSISIDFGIMEKARNVYVRRSDFGWSDIGTWGSLYQFSGKDENGNVLPGNSIMYNSRGNIVKSRGDKLTVIDSLDDYIVVDTEDVLMICPKDKEQNIKNYIDDVKFKIDDKFI